MTAIETLAITFLVILSFVVFFAGAAFIMTMFFCDEDEWLDDDYDDYDEYMTDDMLREKKAEEAYRAAQKSLKLDMMQAEALRQMRDVASKYDTDFLKKSKKDVSS